MNNQFDVLADQLVARGFKVDPYMTGSDGMLIVEGPKYRIRVFDDKFQVGFEETFDKWSNSTDYEDKVPHTERALDAILEFVGTLNKCHFCTSWTTPHRIANRPCCDECHKAKHKPKKKKR